MKKRKRWTKKVNKAVHRLNTYLEPRVIRHGWTPQIGGGMGNDSGPPSSQWFMPGKNPITGLPGAFDWMVDISSHAVPAQQSLLVPHKRHNPLLYMRVSTKNDINHFPNATPNAGGLCTCQPRIGQVDGALVPVGNPQWVGGSWSGSYDTLLHSYLRPSDMLSTARLYQTMEDCIAYKQFPFIPRVTKNFDENVNLTTGNYGGQSGTALATNVKRLEKFETRDGDRLMVRNNYHKFMIEVFPDMGIDIPVANVESRMPGLPEEYAKGGTLDTPLGVGGNATTTPIQTVPETYVFNTGNASVPMAIFPGMTGGVANAGANRMSYNSSATPAQPLAKGSITWPGYISKKPKWFCKIRFVIAKRQKKENFNWSLSHSNGLQLVGCRNTDPSGRRSYLFELAPFLQKHCLSFRPTSHQLLVYNEYLNFGPGITEPLSTYTVSNIFDKRSVAASLWKLPRAKYDYKSALHDSTTDSEVNTNPPDKTLKIIYDKTITLSGRKRNAVHTINTLKGKVLEYLKETQKFNALGTVEPVGDPLLASKYDDNATAYPIKEEFRMWAIVHCHNCQMQMKVDHIFKFDA